MKKLKILKSYNYYQLLFSVVVKINVINLNVQALICHIFCLTLLVHIWIISIPTHIRLRVFNNTYNFLTIWLEYELKFFVFNLRLKVSVKGQVGYSHLSEQSKHGWNHIMCSAAEYITGTIDVIVPGQLLLVIRAIRIDGGRDEAVCSLVFYSRPTISLIPRRLTSQHNESH